MEVLVFLTVFIPIFVYLIVYWYFLGKLFSLFYEKSVNAFIPFKNHFILFKISGIPVLYLLPYYLYKSLSVFILLFVSVQIGLLLVLSFAIIDFFVFKKLAQNPIFVQDKRYLISIIPFIGKILLINKLVKYYDKKYELPGSGSTELNKNLNPEEVLEVVEKPNSSDSNLDNRVENKPIGSN